MKQQRESKMLGQAVSTARSKLYKKVIWSLARKCGENQCHRCGSEIENPEDLSLDHVKSWRYKENAAELYFDLDNVRLSHNICNATAKDRRCNHRVNNKTGFKGVEFRPERNKFRAFIWKDKKVNSLGYYETKEDAARAYDEAAVAHWGEQAVTNQMLGLL